MFEVLLVTLPKVFLDDFLIATVTTNHGCYFYVILLFNMFFCFKKILKSNSINHHFVLFSYCNIIVKFPILNILSN